MALLLAAEAPHILVFQILIVVILAISLFNIIFILVLLTEVLRKLTPRSVLRGLAAAPPHFPAKFGTMRPTRPIIVLLLEVLFTAKLANLLINVVVATVFEFLDSLAHFISFILEHLYHLVSFLKLFQELS